MVTSSWGSRYSIAASTLALLIALGGTAYAANTVRSADIVNGAVKSIDIGNGAVQGVDIRNGTVGTVDIATASLGRSPRIGARVLGSNANLLIAHRVTDAEYVAAGVYTVTVDRDVSDCLTSVTPRADGRFATTSANTDSIINVRVVNAAGDPAESTFDLVVVC